MVLEGIWSSRLPGDYGKNTTGKDRMCSGGDKAIGVVRGRRGRALPSSRTCFAPFGTLLAVPATGNWGWPERALNAAIAPMSGRLRSEGWSREPWRTSHLYACISAWVVSETLLFLTPVRGSISQTKRLFPIHSPQMCPVTPTSPKLLASRRQMLHHYIYSLGLASYPPSHRCKHQTPPVSIITP